MNIAITVREKLRVIDLQYESLDVNYQYSPRKQVIFERDNFICNYCGRFGDTLDHIVPKSKGGSDLADNLVCCCHFCNQIKQDMSVDVFNTFRYACDFSGLNLTLLGSCLHTMNEFEKIGFLYPEYKRHHKLLIDEVEKRKSIKRSIKNSLYALVDEPLGSPTISSIPIIKYFEQTEIVGGEELTVCAYSIRRPLSTTLSHQETAFDVTQSLSNRIFA